MQRKQQTRLDTLAEVLTFLDDYAIELGNVSKSPSRAELCVLVKHLTVQATAQAAAVGEFRLCALRRRTLRRELCTKHLQPIAAIAQAELADTAVAQAFKSPGVRADYELLLERAEAVGDQARKYRGVFQRHGLRGDFVRQLRAIVDAMDRVTDERVECIARHKAATAALASGFRRAVSLLSVLNALVESRVGSNAGLRAAWRDVRRGEAARARSVSST
jgi:hypothetical protein